MTTTDVLRQAKELLADPVRWHKGGWGMGPGGSKRYTNCDRFCAQGAIDMVCGITASSQHTRSPYFDHDAAMNAMRALRHVLGGEFPGTYNDLPTTTHADILDVFDWALLWVAEAEAIEARKAERQVPVAA